MSTNQKPTSMIILDQEPPSTPDETAEENGDVTPATIATLAELTEQFDAMITGAALKTVTATASGLVHPFSLRFAEAIIVTRKRAGAMKPVAMWIDTARTEANARKGIAQAVTVRIDDDLWESVVLPSLNEAADKLGVTFGAASGQWSRSYVKFSNVNAPENSRGKFRLSIRK